MDRWAHGARRWWPLVAICGGVLMVVLSATIVNVALPNIRGDLEFNEASLAWVVNAYVLAFGGFLLVAGRLGDLYGQGKVFLLGLALFTSASFACGLADTKPWFVGARVAQGLGGATVVSVALSLIANLYVEAADRAKAVGAYAMVCGAGSSIGLLLGGALTSFLGWRWIFFVNLPVGIALAAWALRLFRGEPAQVTERKIDLWGFVSITASLMLAMYGISSARVSGNSLARTAGLLCAAGILIAAFVAIERRVRNPLVPLQIFRIRSFAICSGICLLWTAAVAPWSFTTVLYMGVVLGYGPMQIGLAFLPASLIMSAFAFGLGSAIVARFGIGWPLAIGLVLDVIGLALLSRARLDGNVMADVIPGMTIVALGAGIASIPLLMAAMSGVDSSESGVASGIYNTLTRLGAALGLAIATSLSDARTADLLEAGAGTGAALTGGYRVAFLMGTICAGAAALIGIASVRSKALEFREVRR